MNRTILMIKPTEPVRQINIGYEIERRLVMLDLKVEDKFHLTFTPDGVEKFCEHLLARSDGQEIMQRQKAYYTSGPSIIYLVTGRNAGIKVRNMLGATDPVKAAPGTIRGDMSTDSIEVATLENRGLENVAHASDSPEAAEREEKLLGSLLAESLSP